MVMETWKNWKQNLWMKTEGRRKALNTSAFSLSLVDLQPDLAVFSSLCHGCTYKAVFCYPSCSLPVSIPTKLRFSQFCPCTSLVACPASISCIIWFCIWAQSLSQVRYVAGPGFESCRSVYSYSILKCTSILNIHSLTRKKVKGSACLHIWTENSLAKPGVVTQDFCGSAREAAVALWQKFSQQRALEDWLMGFFLMVLAESIWK